MKVFINAMKKLAQEAWEILSFQDNLITMHQPVRKLKKSPENFQRFDWVPFIKH